MAFSLALPLPLPTLVVVADPSPRARSHNFARGSPSRASSATRRTCHAATRPRVRARSSVSGGRVQLSQWPQGVPASSCPTSQDLSDSFEDLLKYLGARVRVHGTGASTKYQHRNRRARRQGKGRRRAYILCELDLPTLHEVGRECHHRERLLLPVPFVARERGDAHPVLRTVVEDAVGVFPVAPGASGFLVKPIQGFLQGRPVSACRVENSVFLTHRELRHK